jgi:hypothetical protein
MKGICKSLIAILVTLLVFQPVFSWAGPGARVIPQGKVSVLADGKEVSQFQSEMPLPEGSLMLCKGSCLVQTQNIQLVALNQAIFALAESNVRWDLTIKTGQVDFAIRPGAKPISFHTPHDTVQAERAILPASSGSMVRGSIIVTEKESVVAVQEGALQMMSSDGTQLVQPGQAILLAQTPQSGTQSTQQSDEKKKAGAAPVEGGAAGAGAGGVFIENGALTTVGWVTVGVLTAGAIAGIAVAASGGGGESAAPVSPQ